MEDIDNILENVVLQKTKHVRMVSQKKVLGAALLVTGGTVGAGIVALPLRTVSAGLLPAATCLVGGWMFMLMASLMIVEVNFHCGEGSNFTSMAKKLLGPKWKIVCAALYLFVYTATLVAYIAESATFLAPIVRKGLGELQLIDQQLLHLFVP